MEFAKNFEDLRIWQDARKIVREIYISFSGCNDYSFRDQIQRAAISIMNNIAEGFERRTKKDFAHFLDLSKASTAEVKSMLYVAVDLHYLPQSQVDTFHESLSQLIMSIGALASKLRAHKE